MLHIGMHNTFLDLDVVIDLNFVDGDRIEVFGLTYIKIYIDWNPPATQHEQIVTHPVLLTTQRAVLSSSNYSC